MYDPGVLLRGRTIEHLLPFHAMGQPEGHFVLREGRDHDAEDGESVVARLENPGMCTECAVRIRSACASISEMSRRPAGSVSR